MALSTIASNTYAQTVSEDAPAPTVQESDASVAGIVIDDAGNVGIGTATPDGKLHVKGDLWMELGSTIYINSAPSHPFLIRNRKFVQSTPNYKGDWARTLVNLYAPNNYYYATPSISMAANYGAGAYVGINNQAPTLQLDVNGTSGGTHDWSSSSDERLKQNIRPMSGALGSVLSLQGVHFEWRGEEFADKVLPNGIQTGLIAQDVEKIIPDVVHTDTDGFKSIAYGKLNVLLIEAIKEQQAQIEVQKMRLAELESRLEELE